MAETTTDRETVRRWAEEHGGKPAAVGRTHQGDDVGIIRIMFPDAPQSEHETGRDHLGRVLRGVRKRNLALLYDEKSMFNKIVGRDTAERRARGDHDAARQ